MVLHHWEKGLAISEVIQLISSRSLSAVGDGQPRKKSFFICLISPNWLLKAAK
jgi:hypothetical protein